ncbi:MAG: RtcB family protein [Candidatus Sericytochromatia bacterium]|nr:RtcB family protein [Candidatus Sericytochromatia bacterium]
MPTSFDTLPGTQERVRMFLGEALAAELDHGVYQQARNTLQVPGVEHLCLMPDCQHGYGAPVGSVVVSAERVIPGPVGYDIGCGMALYLTDVPAEAVRDKLRRRAVIDAIDRGICGVEERPRIPGVKVTDEFFEDVLNRGAVALAKRRAIPTGWVDRCERSCHAVPSVGAPQPFTLEEVPERALRGVRQLGSLGGGNHFIELQAIELAADPALRSIAEAWGLFEGQLAVMLHSGSRGFGHGLGEWAFREFRAYNDTHREPYADRELVHAPVGSALAHRYFRFLAAGANYALANRLLMARVVKEAVEAVLPQANVGLLYEISHNLAQWEPDAQGDLKLVHRKGTTRALPAGHPLIAGTRWEATGHPVITPGSMGDWSAIQVGLEGAAASFYSINHGAGRRISRRDAKHLLDQGEVDAELAAMDVMLNASHAPIDEAPAVYKRLDDVIAAVQHFGLAAVVAKAHPLGSIKGSDEPRGSHAKAG